MSNYVSPTGPSARTRMLMEEVEFLLSMGESTHYIAKVLGNLRHDTLYQTFRRYQRMDLALPFLDSAQHALERQGAHR